MIKNFILFFFIAYSPLTYSSQAQQNISETFATAIMLSSSDSISIGIGNFDPYTLLDKSEENPDGADSISLRNSLSIYNLPYTFVLDKPNEALSDKIMLRLTYIKQETKNNFSLVEQSDDNVDEVFSIYNAYSHYIPIANNFKLRLRLGGYLMHHKNKHNYNSALSNSLKPALENIYFNTNSNAAIVEPNIKLTYTQMADWGKWQVSSDLNYFVGKVYSGSTENIGAVPTGWHLDNEVKFHFDIHSSKFYAESIYFKLQRTDMRGDMTNQLQANYFYSIGGGILLDIHKITDLAENVGIGLNINAGTSLSGGSIVFYFNEF